jgi:TfoX/Sxy family transcriptional regulator of competence genes
VLVDGLSDAQIAGLQYHGGLRLIRHPVKGADAATEHCKALVTTPAARDSLGERVNLPDWAFKATVWRLSDRRERLLVYLRIGG